MLNLKNIAAAIILSTMTLSLTACGEEKKADTITAEQLIEELRRDFGKIDARTLGERARTYVEQGKMTEEERDRVTDVLFKQK